uniref:Uncharacterized protein n=1 Tax=Oryza punctata TaxID=4537 RepID=A0A0E0MP54_ORYPU
MDARTRSHQRRAAVGGTTTSTPGGPIQTVHVIAEHGDPLVLQPLSQVLRFIPDSLAMDMDMVHYLMTEPTKNATTSTAKAWYRKLLAEKILNNLTGILSFCNKLPEPESSILKELRVDAASIQAKLAKQRQYIPRASIHPQLAMGCSSDRDGCMCGVEVEGRGGAAVRE